MKEAFTLSLNGENVSVEAEPDMPLLYALRGPLQQRGPKFGCGLAQCGACTVIMDGVAIRSCVTPVSTANGAIRTLDGIGTADNPHPVQQAFIDEEVPQCGYCTNGWMMYTVAMLERDPNVTHEDILNEFAGLKCRCGTHVAILRAVKRAAEAMRA